MSPFLLLVSRAGPWCVVQERVDGQTTREGRTKKQRKAGRQAGRLTSPRRPPRLGSGKRTDINDNPHGPGGEPIDESEWKVREATAAIALDSARPPSGHGRCS